MKETAEPTEKEVNEHNLTHLPFRTWCAHCIRGKAKNPPHKRQRETNRQTDRQKDRKTERQTDRLADKQRGRDTDRQTRHLEEMLGLSKRSRNLVRDIDVCLGKQTRSNEFVFWI